MGSRIQTRAAYLRRVFSAYWGRGNSQLTFWHETPEVNDRADTSGLGEYYMSFRSKADYPGHHDQDGVPMLDYRGHVGLQYNPIAIAQWGLANFNLMSQTGDPNRRDRFLRAADWLVRNLEQNPHGVWVWNHHFDWEYRDLLKAPWYSALAQGQAISALVRAHALTGDGRFEEAAALGIEAFWIPVEGGGVAYLDGEGDWWFEETIVDPPTHILNGFLWAAWGVYDYILHSQSEEAKDIFGRGVSTLKKNLVSFDTGYWSLYEHSGTRMKMLASPFYHRLHIVQLRVMASITGEPLFDETATRWETYARSMPKRWRALAHKSVFKLTHY